MHFELLREASAIVLLHMFTALIAVVLGAYQLIAAKGGAGHQWRGRIWAAIMLCVCFSSFGIRELQPDSPFWGFSWIHCLSVYTIAALIYAIRAAIKGDTAAHLKTMTGVYIGGLLVAGAFTFWPGRLLHKVFLE